MLTGPTAAGAEFLVNGYTASRQDEAAVASDSAGDFVVAWEGTGSGGYGIYASACNAGRPGAREASSRSTRTPWREPIRLPRWRWIRPAISSSPGGATPMAAGPASLPSDSMPPARCKEASSKSIPTPRATRLIPRSQWMRRATSSSLGTIPPPWAIRILEPRPSATTPRAWPREASSASAPRRPAFNRSPRWRWIPPATSCWLGTTTTSTATWASLRSATIRRAWPKEASS